MVEVALDVRTTDQKHIDDVVFEWQEAGRRMSTIYTRMRRRDEQYFTGSAITRAHAGAWIDDLPRRHGNIFAGN